MKTNFFHYYYYCKLTQSSNKEPKTISSKTQWESESTGEKGNHREKTQSHKFVIKNLSNFNEFNELTTYGNEFHTRTEYGSDLLTGAQYSNKGKINEKKQF